jgi:uncharacterized lipoprotein YajG
MNRSIALILATGTLLAGCSEPSQTATSASSTNVTDWGVVEIAANTPKHLSLDGKDCILTATSLGAGKIQIVIKTEGNLAKEDASPSVPVGTPVETSVTTTVPSGDEINGYVGQKPVRFTPTLKAQ